MKISAALIAWNEAQTIDLALKSISNFVDEVIIADTGSFDGTVKKAEECLSEYHISGEVLNVKANTLGQARLAAIEKTIYDWILLIDANLVLSEALKKELGESQKHGFLGMVRSLNLMGDYEHYFTPLPLHDHHDTLFHKSTVTWLNDLDRPIPLVNRRRLKRWAINLSRVRPAWRSWYRGEPFDPDYYNPKNRNPLHEAATMDLWTHNGKFSSLVEYIETKRGLSLDDVKRIAPEWYLNQLNRFAEPLCPQFRRGLPEPIIEEQRTPRYSLIYQGGKIIGRYPTL